VRHGYSCAYQNNLFLVLATTPLPAEAHPRIVFESLFGEAATSPNAGPNLRKKASPALTRSMRTSPGCNATSGRGMRQSQSLPRNRPRDRTPDSRKAEGDTKDNPLPDLDRPVGVPAAMLTTPG